MKRNILLAFALSLAFAALATAAFESIAVDPTPYKSVNGGQLLTGEIAFQGVMNDGEGRILCLKSGKEIGTCAAGTVGFNGCPGNCK